MPEPADDGLLERVVAELRVPDSVDLKLDARIMAAVRVAPHPVAPGPVARLWHWLREPRLVRLSPLSGLAAAAALFGVLWIGTRLLESPRPSIPALTGTPATYPVEFVLTAPAATSVVVVGDFNDWDPAATPLTTAGRGVWTATVTLPAGRHRYAFLLDGTRWITDPTAPPAADDDFDTPNSVVTVGT